MTGVVETSSITIRNSAVYQQLLCIGQQCHNRYRTLKEAAITNQPLNKSTRSGSRRKILIVPIINRRIPKANKHVDPEADDLVQFNP